jgi:hypothetical protein
MIETRATLIAAAAAGTLFSTIGLSGVAFAQTAPPPTTPPTTTTMPPTANTQTTPATANLPGAVSNDPAQVAKDTAVIQPSAKTPPTPLPTKAAQPGVNAANLKAVTLFDGHTPGQPLPADPTIIKTLDDAIAVAFMHNPQILQAQESALQTIDSVDQIKAIRKPTVSASGTYSRLANGSSSGFSGGGASPASISDPFGIGLSTTPPGSTPIDLYRRRLRKL